MKKITFTILTFFLVFSCEKENDFAFSGITERDTHGKISGSIDETDWKFDDVWNKKEENLFDADNFERTNFITGWWPDVDLPGSNCTVYPNPAKEDLCLYFLSTADTLEYVIVNNNYNIIYSYKVAGLIGGVWVFDVSDREKFKANTVYRMYYKLKFADSKVERGHGDIMVIN